MPDNNSKVNDCPNDTKIFVLFLFSLLMIVMGIIVTPSISTLLEGLSTIITHPSLTDFDSFYWGGSIGAPFVQTGLVVFLMIVVYKLTRTSIQGPQLAATMMVTGFSFYGKNILNIWFPVIGFFLYALLKKRKLKDVTAAAFFATCLGPVFSRLAFFTPQLGQGSAKAIIIGIVVCIFSGFLTGVFADFLPKLHKGLLVYNIGMAAGCVAMLINAVFKIIGYGYDAHPYSDAYTIGNNPQLLIMLIILFAYFIIAGLILKGKENLTAMLEYSSPGGDHVAKFGTGTCFIVMGIFGLLATTYVLMFRRQLNGITLTCIFAVAGLSAFGSSLKTHVAPLLGVAFGAFITGGINGVNQGNGFIHSGIVNVASRGMVLSSLFSCGVAPVTGNYGFTAGFLVGLAHSILVPYVSPLHGWMLLYNNGLSLGIVTTLLYPIYTRLPKFKKN